MITLTPAMESLLKHKVHRFARCWQITRTDGIILRFTEHSEALVLADGYTYSPTGGFDASALQKSGKLETTNMEFRGIISNAAITHEDLRTGLYRDAEVLEKLIDWGYPWAGEFRTAKYWITEVTFTGETWEAKIEGLGRYLSIPIGETYTLTCRYDLGESRCGINLASYKDSGTIESVVTQRVAFLDSTLFHVTTDYYTYGNLEWTSGNNNGRTSEIKFYDKVTGDFILFLSTPFDMQVGDTFDVYAGCDKLKATCGTKFSNFINFGGFPYIPGTYRQMKTPAS